MKINFSKTDFFSKIFQSARNSHKVLPRTFKNNHKEMDKKLLFFGNITPKPTTRECFILRMELQRSTRVRESILEVVVNSPIIYAVRLHSHSHVGKV